MTFMRLVKNSVKFRMNKITILILAVSLSTAILSGALFLGDSVKQTILTLGSEKVGKSRYIINSSNVNKMLPQIYTDKNDSEIHLVPILKLPARSLINNNGVSLENFNAYAVDSTYFNNYQENYGIKDIEKDHAVINEYLAEQLDLNAGDKIQFRCGYFSNLTPSFSFYEDSQGFFTKQITISKIIPNRGAGRFSTSVNQGNEPLILLNLGEFQEQLYVGNKVNLYLSDDSKDINDLEEMIDSATSLSDLGYHVKDYSEKWKLLSSDQLFIAPEMLSKIKEAIPESYPVFSYFLNSAQYSDNSSPFHFIVGLDNRFLESQYNLTLTDNQSIISKWLSEDLNANTNDEISIEYFVTNNNQKLVNSKDSLIIKNVKPIEFFISFKGFVPEFPGFSDTASCNDWDPSIPIDLDKVRDKDEEYWNTWEFTPKLLISYNKAKKLWGTEQAVATSVLIPATTDFNQLDKKVMSMLTLADKGYVIEDYINRVSTSGNNSINFSELFIGLSFLIIIAAIFLLIFVAQIFYTTRKDEIFILKATGFARQQIIRIYLAEVLIFTVPGILLGLVLGIAYNYLLMSGLTTIWYEAARLDSVLMSFTLKSILISGITSLSINLIVSFWVIKNIINKVVIPAKPKKDQTRLNSLKLYSLCASILIILLILLVVLYLSKIIDSSVAFFFISGGILLILFPILAVIIVKILINKRSNSFSLGQFALRSINSNIHRTVSIIFITALSVFMIISIGANKLISNTSNSQAGTGMYDISVITAQPISPQKGDYSESWGIPESKILPIRIKEGDEASCLNLNQVRSPRISSVNPEILSSENRFKIVEEVKKDTGWEILDKQLADNKIPAIADKGVLKWSLGLKTGDSLNIMAEDGKVYSLVFMSALSSSIFQGSVVISENNFMKLFPSSKGFNRFLIDFPKKEKYQDIDSNKGLLIRVLRPYGAIVRSNINILDEYYSVQNSYISIFFQLGLMAIIFAVAGISILLLKKIQEEKEEIAIQQIIGFRKKRVFMRLFVENYTTILFGIFAGAVSSIIALLPIFREELNLLLEYPVSAFIVISFFSFIFLSVFISMGLKTFNRMIPESR